MKKESASTAGLVVPRSVIMRFCLGVTIMLALCGAGCGQSAAPAGALGSSEEAALRGIRAIAENAAHLLNVYMEARVTEMMVCSATCDRFREGLRTPDALPEANQALEKWLKISGAYQAILLVDKSGACVASAPTGLVGRNLAGDQTFTDAAKGKVTVSDVHESDIVGSLDTGSKGRTLSIAAPVMVNDEVAGVLLSYLKWSRLKELTSSFSVGETGYVFVLDRQNQIVAHPSDGFYGIALRDPRINLPDLDDAARNRADNKRFKFTIPKTGEDITKLAGFAYLKAYRNFPGLGWTVVAIAEERELTGSDWPWRRLFR